MKIFHENTLSYRYFLEFAIFVSVSRLYVEIIVHDETSDR